MPPLQVVVCPNRKCRNEFATRKDKDIQCWKCKERFDL